MCCYNILSSPLTYVAYLVMWNCFASFPLISTTKFGRYYYRLYEEFCLVNCVSERSHSSEEMKHGNSLSFSISVRLLRNTDQGLQTYDIY
jgi:hypothetical protein